MSYRALKIRLGAFIAGNPLASVVLIFGIGVMFWGAFNTSLELTNRQEFCISCHEMNQYVYQDFKQTQHFANRTGVRATCPDCHVPKQWVHMVVRKIGATNELYHKVIGSIDTPEKFQARRLHLARNVWRSMERTDSRECRNCHDYDSMRLRLQTLAARDRHERSIERGKTCIDCHKGIAHKLPEAYLEAEHARFEQEKVACSDCHEGLTQAPRGEQW